LNWKFAERRVVHRGVVGDVDVHRVSETSRAHRDRPSLDELLRHRRHRGGHEFERQIDAAAGAGIDRLVAAVLVGADLERRQLHRVVVGLHGGEFVGIEHSVVVCVVFGEGGGIRGGGLRRQRAGAREGDAEERELQGGFHDGVGLVAAGDRTARAVGHDRWVGLEKRSAFGKKPRGGADAPTKAAKFRAGRYSRLKRYCAARNFAAFVGASLPLGFFRRPNVSLTQPPRVPDGASRSIARGDQAHPVMKIHPEAPLLGRSAHSRGHLPVAGANRRPDAAALAKVRPKNHNGYARRPDELAAMQADTTRCSCRRSRSAPDKDRGYQAIDAGLRGPPVRFAVQTRARPMSAMTKEFIEDWAIHDVRDCVSATADERRHRQHTPR